MISFISLLINVISKPVIYSLSKLSICLSIFFHKSQGKYIPLLATLHKIFHKLGMPRRAPPNCIILDNKVFEKFLLADEPFAKALEIFKTCLSVNSSLCGKLVSSLEFIIKFDQRFKVTSVPVFIADFNFLSCELDKLESTVHIESLY